MAAIAGCNSRPSSVNAYSTVGGEVFMTWRETTPAFSSSFSRVDSTFADTPSMSPLSSLKRRGDSLRYQMTCGVHAPPKNFMHFVRGHSPGGGSTLLLRTRTINHSPLTWLP